LVEFFDYNCGYCKRAMTDMLDLLKNDPKLKFVLKDVPCLGEGSVQAAQVAGRARARCSTRAARSTSNSTRSSWAAGGQADRTRGARGRTKRSGFDMAKLEKDMAGDEVKAQIEKASSSGKRSASTARRAMSWATTSWSAPSASSAQGKDQRRALRRRRPAEHTDLVLPLDFLVHVTS